MKSLDRSVPQRDRGADHEIGHTMQVSYELAGVMRAKPQHIFTEAEITTYLTTWRKSIGLRDEALHVSPSTARRVVSNVRSVLEQEHGTSLASVKNVGWKIASQDELAILSLRHVRKTIVSARRSHQLLRITPVDKLPDALKTVFKAERDLIGVMASDRQQFLQRLTSYQAGAGSGLPGPRRAISEVHANGA